MPPKLRAAGSPLRVVTRGRPREKRPSPSQKNWAWRPKKNGFWDARITFLDGEERFSLDRSLTRRLLCVSCSTTCTSRSSCRCSGWTLQLGRSSQTGSARRSRNGWTCSEEDGCQAPCKSKHAGGLFVHRVRWCNECFKRSLQYVECPLEAITVPGLQTCTHSVTHLL